ncbi:type II toxin-antitoxin system RelE/ParE family toxin [Microbacterium sp.]|uniref:type II toxin-antitoxin system RelE/ParE family toxin n=1 Tax=Microbacterium sp. TaxID=51671 RepID=UPI0039E3277E
MTRRVVTTARADEDIASAVAYYVDAGAYDAAMDLVDALKKAFESLSAFPSIGSPRLAIELGLEDVRTLTLQRFPYALVFTDADDAVRVHRVLHTARDIGGELAER